MPWCINRKVQNKSLVLARFLTKFLLQMQAKLSMFQFNIALACLAFSLAVRLKEMVLPMLGYTINKLPSDGSNEILPILAVTRLKSLSGEALPEAAVSHTNCWRVVVSVTLHSVALLLSILGGNHC